MLSEKWNFCSTKVNPVNLITRLEEGTDLTKNSSWWRSSCFLFEENQNYSKIDDCENKETFSETLTQNFESEIKKMSLLPSVKWNI